jgi:hypothetical protein
MRIQMLEIAIKPGGTGFEAVVGDHLQAKRIATDARNSPKP